MYTVYPGSSDPFYVVTYCMKWVNTSWTHSTFFLSHLQLQIINYVADTFQALRNSKHRLRRAYICPLHTALLPQVINFVADFSFFLGCVLRNIRGDERRLRGADQRGAGGPARAGQTHQRLRSPSPLPGHCLRLRPAHHW